MPEKRPTLREVAHLAGVSPRTVSRSIDGDPRVAPDTAARIAAAITKLGYRRNEMARALKAGDRTGTIGLVIEDLSNPFYSVVSRAIEEVAVAERTRLYVASSEEDAEREREVVLDMLSRRVDGLLIVPTRSDHDWLRGEIDNGTAVVSVDRPMPGIAVDTVLLDNAAGASEAVAELIKAGHRRIAILGDDSGIWTVQQRELGYRRALRTAGIPLDLDLISMASHTLAEAGAAVRHMLVLPDPPSAVFCTNNRITLGVLLELRRMSPMPDLAVTGFDEFDSAALSPIPLTLVAYDTATLGRRAAELLFRRIAQPSATPETVVVPVHLVQVTDDSMANHPSPGSRSAAARTSGGA